MKKKNLLSKFIAMAIIISIILLCFNKVFANTDFNNLIKEAEYSDEYKKWLSLSEEEKKNTLEPIKYDVIPYQSNTEYLKSMNNVFKANILLKNSLDTRYSLQDIIPENVVIRNQMQTSLCWSFATIGSLETNLALQDKLHGNEVKVYDFSERHMAYSVLRDSFLNGEINEYGFSKKADEGGSFIHSQAYLTNGLGAINEEDMPFENNNDNIDISEIQNKEVQTTVLDTTVFSAPTTEDERLETIEKMKQYISNYGGLYAGIYGASVLNDNYNNVTGAIFCDDTEIIPNHAVTIIGWDDDYSVSNFNEAKRPNNNGAWIAKNSWGEKLEESASYLKEVWYESATDVFNQQGIYSAEEISDEILMILMEAEYGKGKVSIEGDTLNIEVGDNGFVYISYEDVNVYNQLYGIKNALNKKDDHKLYQLDPLGAVGAVTLNFPQDLYLANTFKRDTSKQEKLDKISFATYQGYECEVYVNPNGTEKTMDKLQKVKLIDGDSKIVEPFYNTIEFAEPVDLTGEYFTVVVKIKSSSPQKLIALETKLLEPTATVNAQESFMGTEESVQVNQWEDVGASEASGNLCIKAYTTDVVINEISIASNPNKITYVEGEKFDSTGLKVFANYSDGTSKEITNYTIIDGDNLKLGQTSVTISYSEGNITKTTTIAITVEEKQEENPDNTPEENPDNNPEENPDNNPEEDPDNNPEENPDNVPDETPDDNPTQEKNPTPSNFSASDGKITDIEHYIYTDNTNEDYSKFKIKVSNIKMGNAENDYTYYYYLSSIQGETNIEDNKWKKVDVCLNNNGTITLEISINTLDFDKYNELFESDKLYIYVKEVASLEQKEVETINTISLTKTSEDKIYIDGELSDGMDNNESNQNQNQNNNQNKVDDTTAPGILPQTGTLPIILLVIGFVVIGVISYRRFKNIDK